MTLSLDWNAIRPLNGGREKGFEELCSQLARAEVPANAHFIRKGTPDAGVECYVILPDDAEWGWQSKYFDTLERSQWQQLDESVKAAIEKHPRLVRYYVCVPLDLPDARLDGKKSAKDRWNERVKKWSEWAQGAGRVVEFIFWGSSEMLERLARSEHVGRVRFWFDTRGFDGTWFSARLDEALRAAGPRYTPEVHVELPVTQDLEAFGRTQRFFDRIKALAVPVRDRLQAIRHTEDADATGDIGTPTAHMFEAVQVVLNGFAALNATPAGPIISSISLLESITVAGAASQALSSILEGREEEYDKNSATSLEGKRSPGGGRPNPFRERRFRIAHLESELRRIETEVRRVVQLAGSTVLLLRGAAGTGKTHLLCDVAKDRVAANQPTVLLMGQRFLSNDTPWTQLLQQLDLASLSADEFVGALEAAAQASGERALLVIDGINEGTGCAIWPSHMAAFLAQLGRSAWIGVVLSVRTSYEDLVVPNEVRDQVALVLHEGFREHEYNATKTFFVYYGLELPSTPLLTPEFRNPLFLKTLCKGLHAAGERRLPRGLQGISAVFDLFLNAVNKRLAQQLGFDPRTPLVRRALDAFASALAEADARWLPLTQAATIVDTLLPGREFGRSLFHGMVVEGVLAQDAPLVDGGTRHHVVYVVYERLADHLVTKALLDKHADTSNWRAAFTDGGVLARLTLSDYIAPGLLEALFIQVAERCGQELVELAPQFAQRWGAGDAFRASLIWRSYTAFSDGTRAALSDLCKSDQDLDDTFDVLLTVAALPGHPLNALFLDQHLREDTMADRDAWWSIYLHRAWGTHGAVDRLVDWASAIERSTLVDEDAVDLCATALAWMLTSSNRFLRDRATKALVSLLTGRFGSMIRLVEKFTDVDDLYVSERVYAAAYGVAMRCHEPVSVGKLAACVYRHMFASGSPLPHILLRDYARGVVERAIYLGAALDVVHEHLRPPYKSTWPTIPTEDDIKPLLPDWSKASYDTGMLEWGRNRIGGSVMDDDFARYVIGTNFSFDSRDWLSLRLDEPVWTVPASSEEQQNALVAELTEEERKAWSVFEGADSAYASASESFMQEWLDLREKDGARITFAAIDEEMSAAFEKDSPPELKALWQARCDAVTAIDGAFSYEHAKRLKEIWEAEKNEDQARRPPRFDLRQIQRYILKRVFELGWTEERFGYFDRYDVGSHHGREASKAERVGKKYQWIAYHEIMALVSDHFQYRDQESDQRYEGPWQAYLRDIDPSCTLRFVLGGTSWSGHVPGWWGATPYVSWVDPKNLRDWVSRSDDLPKIEELLMCTDPTDGARWLNGDGHFIWQQQSPPDQRPIDAEHGDIWYICTGYLVRSEDTKLLLEWAENVDLWGPWISDVPEIHRMFFGEHGWAAASSYFQKPYHGYNGWTELGRGCPVRVCPVAFKYLREASGFDCSVDDNYTLRLPAEELMTRLGLQWSGREADFVDSSGQVVARDPTTHAPGPNALLLRADVLENLQHRDGVTLCWAIAGEKRILGPGLGEHHHPTLRMSGAYVLIDSGLKGFTKMVLDDPEALKRSPILVNIRRTP